MVGLLFLISILPVILLGYYVYSKDSIKEPKFLLFFLFVSGFLAALMVMLLDIGLGSFIPGFYVDDSINDISFFKLFCIVFLGISLIEEFCKWVVVMLFGYRSKEFDQYYDIIIYSVFVALGFAFIENILYVVPGGVSLGIYRALFSIPGHACFGIFMGSYLGLAKVNEKKDKRFYYLYLVSSVLVPALMHTIYNFCLLCNHVLAFMIFVVFIIVLYIGCVREIDRSSKMDIL